MRLTPALLQQIIREEHSRSLHEDDGADDSGDDGVIEQVRDVIRKNQNVATYADGLEADDVHELKHVYYVQLPDELSAGHIARHFSDNPGSVWKISKDAVFDEMKKAMDKEKPVPVGFKLKWLNMETGRDIGVDAVISKDDLEGREVSTGEDTEPFGLADRTDDWSLVTKVATDPNNNYELVTQSGDPYTEEHFKAHKTGQGDEKQGSKETVPYVRRELGYVPGNKNDNKTQKINVVTAKSGDLNGKPVVTLMAVYPGIQPMDGPGRDAKDLNDKQQFAKHGYYFLKENKMRLTTKQLRRIIKEEANNLTEMFTSVGGIGFAPIPRRPRSDYHDLYLNETDVDECGEMGPEPVVQAQVDVVGDVGGEPVDQTQVVVDQVVQSGADVADVIHRLVAHLSSRG